MLDRFWCTDLSTTVLATKPVSGICHLSGVQPLSVQIVLTPSLPFATSHTTTGFLLYTGSPTADSMSLRQAVN